MEEKSRTPEPQPLTPNPAYITTTESPSDASVKNISDPRYFHNPEVRMRLVRMMTEVHPARYTWIKAMGLGEGIQLGLIAQVRP